VTEIVSLDLRRDGIRLSLNPDIPSLGQIEEKVNGHPGWLDLEPFHNGRANSFFDVFFEIEVPGAGTLHNLEALRLQAMISQKPPFARYMHLIPDGGIALFDENNNRTPIEIVSAEHITRPRNVPTDTNNDGKVNNLDITSKRPQRRGATIFAGTDGTGRCWGRLPLASRIRMTC